MDYYDNRKFNDIKSIVLRELDNSLSTVSESEISVFCKEICPNKRIFCDATGRSRFQIAGFSMRLAQMGYSVQLIGESTSTAVRANDILLVCSASGNTPAVVRHAQAARQLGCRVLVITASENSALAELSDARIILKAASKKGGSELSIQPMGSLFEQSAGLLFDLLVLQIMSEYKISPARMIENHSNME